MSDEKTPGQLCYEAWWNADAPHAYLASWVHETPETKAQWEAAATSVAAVPIDNAELKKLSEDWARVEKKCELAEAKAKEVLAENERFAAENDRLREQVRDFNDQLVSMVEAAQRGDELRKG